MTTSRRIFAVLSICILATSSTAFADGGGTKRNSSIEVTNEGSTQVGVAVGLTDAELANIASSANPMQAWLNAGGKILNSGQTVEFDVRAGTHRVVTVRDAAEGLLDDEQIQVDRGETVELVIEEDGEISIE